MNKSIFSAILFIALISPSFIFSQINKEIRHDMRPAEVLQYIDGYYVDQPDMDALATEAIIAMLEKLDPHSVYISREDVAEANQQIQGSLQFLSHLNLSGDDRSNEAFLIAQVQDVISADGLRQLVNNIFSVVSLHILVKCYDMLMEVDHYGALFFE